MEPLPDGLRASCALRIGPPCLVASARTEEELLRAAGALEEVLGPLPQAWLLEPEGEGEWRLRADVPTLDALGWSAARERLGDLGLPLALELADPPGLVEALDRGWLVADVVEAGGLRARWLRDPEDRRRPDLHRPSRVEPWLRPLGAALTAAVRTVRADLAPASDQGPDTVAPVVHRPSGRAGVELSLPAACDPVPDRRAILAALAPVVGALGLCPDLDWEAPLGGLVLRLWLAVPPGPGLPGDETVHPGPAAVPPWLEDLAAWSDHAELQVLPRRPGGHDEVAAAVAPLAERLDFGGGPSRWVRTPGGPLFCPGWRLTSPDAAGLDEVAGLPGVAGIRLVPGPPFGLQDAWPAIDPAWRTSAGVVFCRWPDAVHDRDRLEEVRDRPADPRDHEVADATALELRPIVDTAGRHGLEVAGPPSTLAEAGLRDLLDALAALRHPGLGGIGGFGFGRAGVVARRWWRDPPPERAPTFSTRAPP